MSSKAARLFGKVIVLKGERESKTVNDDNCRVCAEVKLLLSPWLLTSKPETGREHTVYFLETAHPIETMLCLELASPAFKSIQINEPALYGEGGGGGREKKATQKLMFLNSGLITKEKKTNITS